MEQTMTFEQLAYWLQGMLEYSDVEIMDEYELRDKMQGIKDHLELVFTKVTPTKVSEPIHHKEEPKKVYDRIDWEKLTEKIKEASKDKSNPIIWPSIPPGHWLPSHFLSDVPGGPLTAYC